MTNNLKKSLFVGLAALSFVSVASATNASAKSYAKVTSNNTLTTDPTTRNFESTGSNALMTKAGTVKGAKTVASKATMKSLMNSKSSKNYFRAYREATTNRGSKYYKVVSMDGKYRGWIYVGGVKSANTTTDATVDSSFTNRTVFLANPSKNTLWDAPQYTQYKASKVGTANVDTTKGFTVDKAATKTREGSLYFHLTSVSNKNVSGWVYAGKGNTTDMGGLTLTKPSEAASENNSIFVDFKNTDGTTNNDLKRFTYTDTSATTTKKGDNFNANKVNDAKAALNKYASDNGYKLNSSDVDAIFNGTKYGYTYRATATKQSTSYVNFSQFAGDYTTPVSLNSADLSTTPQVKKGDLPAGDANTVISSSDLDKLLSSNNGALTKRGTDFISGITRYSDGNVTALANDSQANSGLIAGNVNYSNGYYTGAANNNNPAKVTVAQGDAYHYVYFYNEAATKAANQNTKYGQNVTVVYNRVAVSGSAQANQTNNDNSLVNAVK